MSYEPMAECARWADPSEGYNTYVLLFRICKKSYDTKTYYYLGEVKKDPLGNEYVEMVTVNDRAITILGRYLDFVHPKDADADKGNDND